MFVESESTVLKNAIVLMTEIILMNKTYFEPWIVIIHV